ncbi:MAG: thiosulfate oxidation carrier protein SoxY [Pseudomonadota bacterium]
MELTRRQMLVTSTAALASVAGLPAFASATDDLIAELTGGASLGSGAISLDTPEIAENGNTVPVSVTADGAKSITLYADGNPVPNVATFNFGPLNPTRSAATRIRLAQTQNVVAIAQMEDGSWQMAKNEVKVTIGGCGG